jgi:hypothetical protein
MAETISQMIIGRKASTEPTRMVRAWLRVTGDWPVKLRATIMAMKNSPQTATSRYSMRQATK